MPRGGSMQRSVSTVVVMTLATIGLLATDVPALEVGETAPGLSLPSAGGGDLSLADRDAPTVLIFFRGLW